MLRPLAFRLRWIALLSLTFWALPAWALPPSDQLLPKTTLAYVSIPNAPHAVEAWQATPLGRLLGDPIMEPFRDDLVAQLKEKGGAVQDRIGLSLDDLEGLAGGEFALAIVQTEDNKALGASLVDVNQNLPNAQATLQRIDTVLKGRGAKKTTKDTKPPKIEFTIYDMPARAGSKRGFQVVYFLHDGMLVTTDGLELSETIAANLLAGGDKVNSLSGLETYQKIMERTAHPAGVAFDTHLQWFARPVDAIEAVQNSMEQKFSTQDIAKLARNEGFDAVQAVGGRVSLNVAPYGLIHRTAVYAPQPWKRAMKMADFPNVDRFTPESWVADSADSYVTFSWNMIAGFDNFDTLFDAVVGEGEEGVWKDVLDSLKTDPNGPQLDVRKDLVAHLGTRASVVTETELPVEAHSQRRLFAAETTDEVKLAEAIDKMMKNDKSVKIRTLEVGEKEYKIFLIVPEEQQVPVLDVQIENKEGEKPKHAGGDQKDKLLPHSAITVGHGHLFISTHIDLLEQVLKAPKAEKPLSDAKDYQHVVAHLDKIHAGPRSLQGFTRNDERYEVEYELFREGNLPEADLLISQALNAILDESGDEGRIRTQKLDGSKLPPFAQIRKFLGRGGVYSQTLEDGWVIVGFTLDETDPTVAPVPVDATTAKKD